MEEKYLTDAVSNENEEFESGNNDGAKFHFDFAENKYILYFTLFYAFGLFIGSYFYKIAKSDSLDNLVKISDNSFFYLFFR